MKRITELEKSRILEMYQSIPMKPWLFEQTTPSYSWESEYDRYLKQGMKPEEIEKKYGIKAPSQPGAPTAMGTGDYIGSSRDMSNITIDEMVKNIREEILGHPVAIGAQVFISYFGIGKVALSVVYGLLLAYDINEALSGRPDYFNILFDLFALVSPYFISGLKGLKYLSKYTKLSSFIEALSKTKLWEKVVAICKSIDKTYLASLIKAGLKWAGKLGAGLFVGFLKISNFIDDFVETVLKVKGVGTPVAAGVGGTVGAYVAPLAIEKVVDGITYVWDETTKMFYPTAEVKASDKPKIPRELDGFQYDENRRVTYDKNGNLKSYDANSNEWTSLFYQSSDFSRNYNGGKPYEKGKGGWDETTNIYFHKDAPKKPEQWKKNK
jgi:hypothetical protein